MGRAAGPAGGLTGGLATSGPPAPPGGAGDGLPRAPGGVVGMAGLIAEARGYLDGGGSVFLSGPAGIGKSTLLGALADGFAGRTVLRCALAESESHLPFLGLIDLLSHTGDEVLERLPPHERAVLRSALLRGDDPAGERALLSLRVAVLDLFRVLCAERPVLLVIDDAQWLDRPSAELLSFVARRAGGLPIRALAAVRSESGGLARHGFCPPPVRTLRVPVMTAGEVAALLGPRWPRPMVNRIHEVSGGNPFFALELGRALTEGLADGAPPPDPGEQLPLPDSLRELMLDRLRPLPAGVRRTLVTASAAARPTVDLLVRAGRADAAADLGEAARHGIAEVGAGRLVRFAHPLLAAVAYAEAPPADRLSAHAGLAEAATDPVERARHLALVAPGPDAGIAATLDEAAAAARRRGALAAASRLGRRAADHTPADAEDARAGRLLTAAEDASAAGEYALARRIAQEVLAEAATPARRVRAWFVVIDSAGQALAGLDDVFARALDDAGDDPHLLAPLHYRLAWRSWLAEGDARTAHGHAARSARLAAAAGDRRTEILALSKQASLAMFLGRPDLDATLARALAEPQDPRVTIDHNGPTFQRQRHHLLNERLDEARAVMQAFVHQVRQRGSVESLSNLQTNLARIEIHRGRCDRALDLARHGLRLAEDTGLSQGPALCALALAEAAGGDLDRAAMAADRARWHSEDDGDLSFVPQALYADGHIRLLRGEAAEAAALLRRVRRLEEAQGLRDPAMRRWHGDLAEALVAAGHLDEAGELIDATRALAARLDRRAVLAVMARAAALVTDARGDPAAAAARLRDVAAALAETPFRLEEGRTWLALGRARLRGADPAGARAALREARRVFSQARARPWLALVAADLDRARDLDHAVRAGDPGPGRPAAPGGPLGGLGETEARIALLVAEGATNREIAARLFVSVKTVEAALTRTYRKLGVRSRVDLARLAAGAAGRPPAGG
ncbi:helix-turn-helix transcriptional regulator [Actinomadura parmotrematis]|uniref:AAA family ATPase n=1 Tax=Actinomadura parmotrematis TaxID=2864039 RepID=A0ABS7FR32_9ACTN|nr:LuxR family transcriptional regulator [Actinomadura parmotrematis]MBW8482869.1 AAA family ATPase [Actinomadura parmotrematis]